MSQAAPVRPRILWDVVEEHFEEGAYGAFGYARALRSPVRTLSDLERYPEERLIAQVAGLRVGGAAVRERILVPALMEATEEEPERLVVAAWALMEDSAFDPIADLLQKPLEPWACAALADAARHVENQAVDSWLDSQLAASPPALDLCALLWLAHARQRSTPELLFALQQSEPRVVAAAAQAARYAEPTKLLGIVQYLLDHEDAAVRDAALLCGLAWGATRAWLVCKDWALDPAQPSELATVLYAALGTRADHGALLELLRQPATRQSTLFALGFSGDAGVYPELLAALDAKDPLEAKLAAQSLGLIFGFAPGADEFSREPPAAPQAAPLAPAAEDPEAQATLPPLEEDDLGADLVPAPEDELPLPHAPAIADHCARVIAANVSAQRLLYGKPLTAAQTAETLRVAPLRVRHALALAHGVRSGGTTWLDTRASTARQRTGIARVAASVLSRHAGF